MDRQINTGHIFFDFKKSFNLDSHECMLSMLEHQGVRGTT